MYEANLSLKYGARRASRLLVLLLLPLVVASCATAPTTDQLETRVREVSQRRWTDLLAKRYEKLFDYLTAASKHGLTAQDYAKQMAALGFRDARIQSAKCTPEVCTVTVEVDVNQRVPKIGSVVHTVVFSERWVVNDGEFGLIRK